MAVSLGAKKAAVRLLSYTHSTRNIRASVSQIRKFSRYEDRDPNVVILTEHHAAKSVVWPDEVMGPLNVPDSRFALPGNIGTAKQRGNVNPEEKIVESQTEIFPDGPTERQLTIISQLIAESNYMDPEDRPDTEMADCILRKYFENARVELVIQDCPQMIYKDFVSFFPDMPSIGKLSIITITQRTENDMSGWSESVEEEREKLLENFITTATEICHMLKSHNHWCDFVEPSTGQPFIGPYTSTTFYETDERYRHLGFEIEDLGCCKVIYHKKWGTKVFIGSLFTMAPKENKVMQDLLKMLN